MNIIEMLLFLLTVTFFIGLIGFFIMAIIQERQNRKGPKELYPLDKTFLNPLSWAERLKIEALKK
jgi:hypothetical protein